MFKNSGSTSKVKLQEKVPEVPKIVIDYQSILKMKQIIKECSAEVGWLGKVEQVENYYVVTDVYLLNQKVTGVTTELEESAMSDFMQDILKNEGVDEFNKIRLWGHSHVNMAVIPSGQDDETFKEYYQDCNFFIRLIANKKDDMRIDIAIKEDGYIYHNIPWMVRYPDDLVLLADQKKELEDQLAEVNQLIDEVDKRYADELVDVVKAEVNQKVHRQFSTTSFPKAAVSKPKYPYSTMSDWYDDYDDYYGYGYGYDYIQGTDTISSKMEFKNYVDGKLYPIYKNSKQEVYQPLSDILSQDEFEEIVYECKDRKAVQNLFKGDRRFANYTKKDWQKLYDDCNDIAIAIDENLAQEEVV